MKSSYDYLKHFGLTEMQIEIYLSLLKSGPSTILNLSNRLKLNRTSIHLQVQELIKKGLLSEVRNKTKRSILALPPERFNNLIEVEEQELKQKRDLISTLIESVYKDTSYIKEVTDTQVKYYNTIESIDWLYDEILKSNSIKSFVNAEEIIKVFPKNSTRFLQAIKRGAKLWDLHTYSDIIEKPFDNIANLYPNFHLKSFPPSVKFDSMDYLLFDGKIAVVYGFPKPHAILIENDAFFNLSVALFDLIWGIL